MLKRRNMTDQPDHDAAEITRIRTDIQARIDRGQELHRLLVDNLACAAQFLESCRQAMKRLDFTQATIDAHISEDHRLIAHRLAVEIRRLNTEIDLERQYLRYLRTTNHQQRPPRPAAPARPARHAS
jgi:DNA polymerase III epsilon subunit-like protein